MTESTTPNPASPANTPTPRTDEQGHWHTYEDGFHLVEKCPNVENASWAPIDFARTLERDLAAMTARCAAMEESGRITVLGLRSLSLDIQQVEAADKGEQRAWKAVAARCLRMANILADALTPASTEERT